MRSAWSSGLLFWPRGAGRLVGDDLADAFRRGSRLPDPGGGLGARAAGHRPDTAIAAVTAGIRLDDALRGYLAEQGAKRMSKDDLWQLVMSSMRLRLTAHSLAGLRGPAPRKEGRAPGRGARCGCSTARPNSAGFYGGVAAQVGHGDPGPRLGPCWSHDSAPATGTRLGAPHWPVRSPTANGHPR